ncbi:MAG: hypothetical protein KDD94_02540 [Calditrichaeota bacterium]|nr:hypothetical protein [Calditrichota bacterium]
MLFLIIIHLLCQLDSISLKSIGRSTKTDFVLRAVSDDYLILLEKEKSTLYAINYKSAKIESFSFDQVIDPIADLHISYDKTIVLLTQFNPTLVRFDRLLNIIETQRLPSAITEINAFYELKTGAYLLLSRSQKKLFIYNKRNQLITETIESGTYPKLQFTDPKTLFFFNSQVMIADRQSMHLFNRIPNYKETINNSENLFYAENNSKGSFKLMSASTLIFNGKIIADTVLSATLSGNYLFYLDQTMELHRFALP